MKDFTTLQTLLETAIPPTSFVTAYMRSNQLENISIALRDSIRHNYTAGTRKRTQRKVTIGSVSVFSTDKPSTLVSVEPAHDRLNRQVASGVLLEMKLLPLILASNWTWYRYGTVDSLFDLLRHPFRPSLHDLALDLRWILRYHTVGRSAPLCLKTAWKIPVVCSQVSPPVHLTPRIKRYLRLVETAAVVRLQQWLKKKTR